MAVKPKRLKSTNDSAESKNGHIPFAMLIPNVVTLTGLCFGLFAIKYALVHNWEVAVMLVVIAAFIDGFDGKIARMLNATSNFGAQLDSLSDFFNFSVAPALITYLWIGKEIKGVGWGVALFFIICGALRLARFNAGLDDETIDPRIKDGFFEGVSAPCAAGLSLLPMITVFLYESELGYRPEYIHADVVLVYCSFIAVLMISRVPTLSLKRVKIKKEYKLPVLAIAMLYVALLAVKPWVILPLTGIVYLLSIPYSIYSYIKLVNEIETEG